MINNFVCAFVTGWGRPLATMFQLDFAGSIFVPVVLVLETVTFICGLKGATANK